MKSTRKLILLLLLLAALAIAIPLSASAAETAVYEHEKPVLAEGEYGVSANGHWIDFGEAKPYAETATVDGKEVVTVYAPVEPVAEALGCTFKSGADKYELSYNGCTATFAKDKDYTVKNGVAYASLNAWVDAFAENGSKLKANGNYQTLSLRNDDLDLTLKINGVDYTFTSGIKEDPDSDIYYTYRETRINQDLPGKSLLIVFLHGGSVSGTDNMLQLEQPTIHKLCDYFTENKTKAIIIAPQCYSGTVSWKPIMNYMAKTLEEYIPANNVDADRVYISGASMGARGTWEMLRQHEDMFAAAMPLSSMDDSIGVYPLDLTIPIYATVGENDTQPYPTRMPEWCATYAALGGTVRCDVNAGYTHVQNCELSFTNERLDWFFSWTRGEGRRVENATLTYDYVKPELKEGEVAVNANGQWVDFGDGAQPYGVTETVDGKEVTTYYAPLKATAIGLGGYATTDVDGKLFVYYDGSRYYLAEGDYVTTEGEIYVPMSFFTTAFESVGAKIKAAGAYQLLSVRNDDLDLILNVNNVDYTFTAGASRDNDSDAAFAYRVTKINQQLPGKSILVVFLHGGGISGPDNMVQLEQPTVRDLCKYFTDNNIKAILMLPQCVDMKIGWSPVIDHMAEAIEAYIPANNVDADRVYISGASMGARGTWDMLLKHEDIFAAAMPLSSMDDKVKTKPEDVHLPIYATVGENDTQPYPTEMPKWCAAYAALGGTVRCDVNPGYTHVQNCELSLTSERLDWMFSFTRGEGVRGEAPASPQTGVCIAVIAVLGAVAAPVAVVARRKSK